MYISSASLNQIPGNISFNKQNILSAINTAKLAGSKFLCLPELCITAYDCQDMFYSDELIVSAKECLFELVSETKGITVTLGLPLYVDGKLYNAVAVVSDGVLLGFTCKSVLANDGIHYEARWFKEWPLDKQSYVSISDNKFEVSNKIYNTFGINFIVEICRDAWVEDRVLLDVLDDVDLVLNSSASHFALGKRQNKIESIFYPLKDKKLVYVYANQLGNIAGNAIYAGDTIIFQNGRVVVDGNRFSYKDYSIITEEVDFSQELSNSSEDALLGFKLEDDYTEFTKAVSLGLFDYLRKTAAKSFALSLSGGMDSSTCACLVYSMYQLALKELGKDGLKQKLGIDSMQDLLHSMYQKSSFSSEATYLAANKLSEYLGASFYAWDVDNVVDEYLSVSENFIGRKLTWEQDNLALQNIQARARAPSIWLLANLYNAVVLVTSNRSEITLGYNTQDGDTAGGLAPIAGVSKQFIKKYLNHFETNSIAGISPVKALSFVNANPPSAELKDKQLDEEDLMPYNLVEKLERLVVLQKLPKAEVIEILSRDSLGNISKKEIVLYVDKFFKLLKKNQWKRERAALSFMLDDFSMDAKTWFRYPVIN